MQMPRGLITLIVWGTICFSTKISLAQPEQRNTLPKFRESVSLNVNNAVLKKNGFRPRLSVRETVERRC